jgi:hypothetical protein
LIIIIHLFFIYRMLIQSVERDIHI